MTDEADCTVSVERQAPDRKRFRVHPSWLAASWRSLWAHLGLAVAPILFCSVSLKFEPESPVWPFLAYASLLLFGAYQSYAWWRKFGHLAVEVSPTGIRALAPPSRQAHFLWSDIFDVRYTQAGYELQGAPGAPTLQLHPCLTGFSEILRILVEKVDRLRSPCSLPARFQCNMTPLLWNVLELGLLTVLGGYLLLSLPNALPVHKFGAQFCLFLLSVNWLKVLILSVDASVYIFTLRELVVDARGFQRVGCLKRAPIPFSDVVAIELAVPAEKGESGALAVVATLRGGKRVSVCPFGANPLEMYQALRTGWEQSRELRTATLGTQV